LRRVDHAVVNGRRARTVRAVVSHDDGSLVTRTIAPTSDDAFFEDGSPKAR
jgi:hypothetical protein